MRLERVILPEIVYDLRGDPRIRKLYREAMRSLDEPDDRRMVQAFDEMYSKTIGPGLGAAWLQGLIDGLIIFQLNRDWRC
jgi:hypothetical protein